MVEDAFGRKMRIAVPADVLAGPVEISTRFKVANDVQDKRFVFRGASGQDYFVTDGVLIFDIWRGFPAQAGHVGQNYWYCEAYPRELYLRKFGDRELIQFILRTDEQIWREIRVRHDLTVAFLFSLAEKTAPRREYCAVDFRRAADLELAAARTAVESLPDAEPEPLPRFVLRCFIVEDAAVRAQPHRFGFRPSAWISLSDWVEVQTMPDSER